SIPSCPGTTVLRRQPLFFLSELPTCAGWLAGAEGFEPPLAVLETAGLPLNLRPCIGPPPELGGLHLFYLISRWGWCLRHVLQNFFISRRSVVVFLFLVEE